MADLIRYDLLVQDALRGVVRQVLTEVARNGLQGEHHFFITFKTATPGLRLSNRMRERYPDEMTVILQHQFWGLTVSDIGFEVGLSFNNVPERLFVPFMAITMFQDPSVTFGLKFDAKEDGGASDDPVKPALAEAPKGQSSKRALATVEPSVPARLAEAEKPKSDKPKPVLTPVGDKPDDDPTEKAGGPKVVSIDAFRKKP